MVITDFKLRYQGSFLGYLWSLLKPLALFSILYVVFDRFLKLGKGVPYYPIYLLLGMVVWGYFTEVTSQCIGSIVGRGDLLRKLNFPRYVIVFSAGFSGLINLALNLVVVAVFMVILKVPVHLSILYLPLLVGELFITSLGIGFFLSALYVKFRDLSYIWDVLLQGAFYATPIIYPLSRIPNKYAKILMLNPMAQIIQDIRYCVVTKQAGTLEKLYGTPWILLVTILITLAIAVAAAVYFRERSRYFAEEV